MQVVLSDDGSVALDFGDREPQWIRVYPPRLGAFRRLQRDRERFAQQAADRIRELPDLEQPSDDDGLSDAEVAEATARRTTAALARIDAVRDINLASAIDFWRLVLIGDESFKGLADPTPSTDPDDWPPGLLYDYREITSGANGQSATQELPLIDRIFTHWGKARSRSGVIPTPAGR